MASGTVVVLGAGMAGLVAAYELERRGHRVVVLEGSGRIGGRIRTHRFGGPAGPVAELGAMRIPARHTLALRYVDELGLADRLRPFRTILSDENNYLPTGRGFLRVREASGALLEDVRKDVPAARHRRATWVFGAWLAALVRAIGPVDVREALRGELPGLLRAADRLDLTPQLYGAGLERIDVAAVFRTHPLLRAECGPGLDGFLDDVLVETGTDLLYLAGGMGQLTERLTTVIRGPVLRGHEATALTVHQDEVVVSVRTAGERIRLLRPAAALCTLPFSVLRTLRLTGFDEDKLEVIGGLQYGAAVKVALHCREAFWTAEGIGGGASATGGRIRQSYYPPAGNDPALGAALLGSYAIADDAHALSRLAPPARHAAVIGELSALHPQLLREGMVLSATSAAWGENRWSRGCAARRWALGPAARADGVRRAIRPQGRLFFAGEHCSSTPAWINGAVESALEAVAAIDGLGLVRRPRVRGGSGRPGPHSVPVQDSGGIQ